MKKPYNDTIDRDTAEEICNRLRKSKRWVKSPVIEQRMHISGSEVRLYVNYLRQLGHPIVSGGKGYKYTQDLEEINQCLAHLYSRARSIRDAAIGLQKAYRILSGERSLESPGLFDFIDNNA